MTLEHVGQILSIVTSGSLLVFGIKLLMNLGAAREKFDHMGTSVTHIHKRVDEINGSVKRHDGEITALNEARKTCNVLEMDHETRLSRLEGQHKAEAKI